MAGGKGKYKKMADIIRRPSKILKSHAPPPTHIKKPTPDQKKENLYQAIRALDTCLSALHRIGEKEFMPVGPIEAIKKALEVELMELDRGGYYYRNLKDKE